MPIFYSPMFESLHTIFLKRLKPAYFILRGEKPTKNWASIPPPLTLYASNFLRYFINTFEFFEIAP